MRQITGPIISLISPVFAGLEAVQKRIGRSGARRLPRATRLYREDELGLAYVWVDAAEDVIEFRAGNLGHPAETARYDAAQWPRLRDHIDDLREMGFAEIAPHDMQFLQIVHAVAGETADEDERAHRDALTEKAGLFLAHTGQGYWIDASTGNGTMETGFLVVDPEIARATLARHLEDSAFADYLEIRIAAPADEAEDEQPFANDAAHDQHDQHDHEGEYPFIPETAGPDAAPADPEPGFAYSAAHPPRQASAVALPEGFDTLEPAR